MYLKLYILLWLYESVSIFSQSNDNIDKLTNVNSATNRIVHKCSLDANQYPFNVMPGTGWDNLANQELGQVVKFSYDKCQYSNDGKFLLPDDVIIRPIKKSILILSSEMFSHYSNYTSMTSKSINVEANHATPFWKISGSFSDEKKFLKNDQIREKSSATRTQLRYELYVVSYQPDIQLNDKFKNRILEMGAAIMADEDQLYPKYLADLIVRDFGTHIIRSVEAGAILSKTDVVKSSFSKKYESDNTELRATASFSMVMVFGLDLKYSQTTSIGKLNEYNRNCASIHINTAGGKIFGSKFTIEEWEKTLEENLVVVDRRGDPIYSVVTSSAVNELNKETLFKVVQLIKEAVNRYYEANTRLGCMNMNSLNFNPDANVDSGDCFEPEITFNFGGAFQVCYGSGSDLCSHISQANPATNGMSCPMGYQAIRLQDEHYQCREQCHSSYFLFIELSRHCNTRCARYALYWCSPDGTPTYGGGLLFGGSYTASILNVFTNDMTCPEYYFPIRFGAHSWICLSTERERGLKDSVAFGGFYSCMVGNSLANDRNPNHTKNAAYWLPSCARGYSSYLIVVDRTCPISYCSKMSNRRLIYSNPPLFRPPFIDIEFGPNLTHSSSFTTQYGVQLNLADDGTWKESGKKSDNGVVTITVTVVATVCIGLVLLGLVLLIDKYRNGRFKRSKQDDKEMMSQEPSTVEINLQGGCNILSTV